MLNDKIRHQNEQEFPNVHIDIEDKSNYDHSQNNNNDLIEGDDIVIEEPTIKKTPLESDAIMSNINNDKKLRIFHQQNDKKKSDKNTFHGTKERNENDEQPPNDNDIEIDYPLPIKLTRAQKLVRDKLKVPPRLFKTFIVTLVLAILGFVLIILGCIESIAEHTPGKGLMFWILGGLVMIPGGFYSYQFHQARKAKDEYERDNIFDNIPEL